MKLCNPYSLCFSFFVASLSCPWSIAVSYDNMKEKKRKHTTQLKTFGFQLLCLNNFTQEILDLQEIIILLVT